jgi:hypothetical protein
MYAIHRKSSNLMRTIARIRHLKHGANVKHELLTANRSGRHIRILDILNSWKCV